MKKSLLILILLISISLSAEWISLDNNSADLFDVTSTRALDETRIDFNLDGYELGLIEQNGRQYSKISYPNVSEIITEGMPDLPRFTKLIAIPNQGAVELEVVGYESEVLSDITIYPRQALQSDSQPLDRSFKLEADFYNSDRVFPEQKANLGTPAIFRDYRVVSVTLNPFRFNPLKNELEIVTNLSLNVITTGRGGENVKQKVSKRSRSFQNLYAAAIANYDQITQERDQYQTPSYLFIHPNDAELAAAVEELAAWKHQKGFEVNLVNTMMVGNTTANIKNYIQEAYDTWENPPEYVVLVGDAGGSYNIPTWTGSFGPGDHGYITLEGDDILADVSIGRISIETMQQMQTILSKIFYYEKEPYLDSNWFERAVMIGDPSSSGETTIDVSQELADMIQFANEDYEITEVYNGGWATGLSNAIDAGVSFANYRGYIGMSGFGTSDVNSLNNGPQMPYATWLTCNTGTFDSYSEAIVETMLRAGTPTIPKGGIGAVGVATSSTHTCFNNSMNYGIYDGIFRYDIQRMGDALLMGKLHLYLAYPDNPLDKVDIFSYWTNLMGDPGLELWTEFPNEINVEYDSEIALGTNYLEVIVTDEDGYPVEDAWVTALMGDDEIFESAYSAADGSVILAIDALSEGEGTLTVTKPNYQAHLGTFTVAAETAFVNAISFEVDDSAGNNDGYANPGETIDLQVTVQNYGTATANAVTVDFSSENEHVTINSSNVDFGNISAGATATAAVSLTVAGSALGSQDIEFDLQFSDSWSDKIYLPIAGAFLNFSEVVQTFDPGDSGNLSVVLDNLGALNVGDLNAELTSSHPFINVSDPVGSYGLILAGDNSTNSSDPFVIQVNNTALPGTQYPMNIELSNASGFQQDVAFVLEVGEVTVNDPLGPDAGGYVCYDMGDLDYYMVPEYDWIEINDIGTELDVSDNGNMGDIEVIDLPFTFQFYGEEYDQMTVCTNGWMAPGVVETENYMNWPIPGPAGPAPLIAAFWDDLISSGAGLYYHHDTTEHLFIIQWDNFICEDQQDETETFQVIIYDEVYYPTTSGNNSIKMQYKDFANVTEGDYGSYHVEHGAYASIGIKDHSGTIGLGYTYYNQYPTAAAELSDETAIFFTEAPVPLEQAYLVINEIAIMNENSLLTQGDNVGLDILLGNLGENTAYEVEAQLSTEDPYVEIINGSSQYNSISNNYPAVNLTEYELQAADDVPDDYHALLVLDITTSEQEFSLNFSIPISKPDVQFDSVAIWDEDNGMLDPGETADLIVTFENFSPASLAEAVIEISENDANITVNESTFMAGDIPGLATVTGIFNVTVNENAEVGMVIPFNAEISGADDYQHSAQFNVNIGLMVEDFESAGFESFEWQFDGNADWVIDGDAYEGDSSAKSGVISHSQSSGMQVSMNIPTAGQISFFYKVSTENNYDKLRFYIDGNEQEYWSGTSDWSEATYSVAAGEHTFKWEYTKDGSVSSNSDCVWVDNIIFPGGSSIADVAFIQGTVDIQGEADATDVTLQFGNFAAHPNAAGEYYLPVAPATHDLQASLAEYLTVTEAELQLSAGEIYNRDFTMVEVASLAVPTELTAEVVGDDVVLGWNAPATREVVVGIDKKTGGKQTVSRNLLGYKLYRDGHEAAEVGSSITSYTEVELPGGLYEYQVTALYSEGESLPSNTATTEQTSAEDIVPLTTELQGNYPNPFNPTTNISFALQQEGRVSLEIYNIKGQKVKNLVDREFSAGRHSVVWNGQDNNGRSVASGVYFYRMRTEGFSALQKMMLIK